MQIAHLVLDEPNIESYSAWIKLMEDPVRFDIFTEIYMRKELTASDLLEVLSINRSTLSHHLTKMVEEDILRVRINPTGHAIKHYSLSGKFVKFEFDGKGLDTDQKRIKAIMLKMQQMSFEFKVAHKLMDRYVKYLQDKTMDAPEVESGIFSFDSDGERHELINGGIFYTTREHAFRFLEEQGELLHKFKKELALQAEKGIEANNALVIGGFPLLDPIFIKMHRRKNK